MIALALGEAATCTITYDDIAPRLTVTKVVVNDDGGTLVVGDFPLFVDGNPVTSGAEETLALGVHTVRGTPNAAYAITFGGDCAVDGSISLALGDVKECTITNDDLADSDGDGLFDTVEETVYGTDPNNPDTDGDGTSDGDEVAAGTRPSVNEPALIQIINLLLRDD